MQRSKVGERESRKREKNQAQRERQDGRAPPGMCLWWVEKGGRDFNLLTQLATQQWQRAQSQLASILHPWRPGTPWSSALRNPVGEERRAWSGSSLLDWIHNRGVQGEPVQKILRSTYILAGKESCVANAVSSASPTPSIGPR